MDNEALKDTIYDLALAVEDNDIDTALTYFSKTAPKAIEQRRRAEAEMPSYDFNVCRVVKFAEIKVDEKGIIKTTRLNQELDSLRTTQSFKDLGEKGNLFPANTKNGKYTGKIVDNVDNHYLLKISSKTIIAIKQESIPNDLDVKKNVSIDFRDNVSIVSYVEPKKDTKPSQSIKR